MGAAAVKSKAVRRITCALLVLGAGPTAALAGDVVDPGKVRALVQPLVERDWAYGLSIGLISDRGTQVLGFGRVSESDSRPPAADTIFEIGSVSKVFTGLILAQMTWDETDSLQVSDPVQKLLGDSTTVPKGAEREITLLHLATHTSGLPRSPDNFDPKDPANPFADYSVAQLGRFLARYKLFREPGTSFEYSNLGIGLLGHALTVKSRLSYEDLLQSRICKPLGMADTCVTLDKPHQSRRAQGHDAQGAAVPDWSWDVLAGAGAIRSTVADLLKFLAANLAPEKTPFGSAITISQAIQFKSLDDEDAVGLAWRIRQAVAFNDDPSVGFAHRIRNDGRIIWHAGETGGYSAFIGFCPEKRVGVVVLANSASIKVQGLGFLLVDLLRTGKAEPLALPAVVKVSVDSLERLVGTYCMLPATTVLVTRAGDQLFMQLAGQEAYKCYPKSERSFFLRVVEAAVTFDAKDDGTISQLVIHQNGQDMAATKVK